jgi:hypothetical protein
MSTQTAPATYDYALSAVLVRWPAGLFPGRCKHRPEHVVVADSQFVRPVRRGRVLVAVYHSVCLSCGMARPATVGGNVLADCIALLEADCPILADPALRTRVHFILARWVRLARRLFGREGWNGRHERIARLIDPSLSMRIWQAGFTGDLGTVISVDRGLLCAAFGAQAGGDDLVPLLLEGTAP